jgi:hypothetical protein
VSAAPFIPWDLPTDPATVLAMASTFGQVYSDAPGNGRAQRHRIYLGQRDGRAVFVTGLPDPFDRSRRIRFKTRAEAENCLVLIRARLMSGWEVPAILAALAPTDADRQRVEDVAARYLEHWTAQTRAGERSPTTLRELERWAKPGGLWGWWWGRDVRALRNGDVIAWHAWLAEQGIGPKTRRNVSDGFKTFLRWASRASATGAGDAWPVPAFPAISAPKTRTPTISVERVLGVLERIPWERRGIFLAIAFESIRFGTACATLLEDFDADGHVIHWHRGRKGQRLDAPVGSQKNREDTRREVWAPPLRAWLEWRVSVATTEDRLAGRAQALLWDPEANNPAKAWNYTSYRRAWGWACKAAGEKIAPQAGTRHSVISALAGVLTPHELQAHTQHADLGSLAHYTVGARPNHAAMVRTIGKVEP